MARRILLAALLSLGLLTVPASAGGLFAGSEELARARAAAATPGASSRRWRVFMKRADAALAREAAPFVMNDPALMRFGKNEKHAGPDDTLSEAVDRLRDDSAAMRDLALAFALTDRRTYGEAAAALLRTWAGAHTPVNFYDYRPDFVHATHDGATQGFYSNRPWNFGLETIWQTYGLINAADAVLLLRAGGWRTSPEDDALIREWLRRLATAVNSGFHAWTRRADALQMHDPALIEEILRNRSDNHLSWALAGLLAAAAALDDDVIADYALEGGVWDDGRSGPYANPSPLPSLIDRAIEADGRVFEERIGRTPTIGYAMFHLQAMTLGAMIAANRLGADLWGYEGEDGGSLVDAYARYAEFLSGARRSPDPKEVYGVRAGWLYPLTPEGFGGAQDGPLRALRAPPEQLMHAVGPAALLFAPDAP